MYEKTWEVLSNVFVERIKQDQKWGEQNHPDVDQVLMNREGGCTPERMADEYEIPSELRARRNCEEMFRRGEGTWAHVAVEELCEAIEAATVKTPLELREELVQLAAVCVVWIECIDRRNSAHDAN